MLRKHGMMMRSPLGNMKPQRSLDAVSSQNSQLSADEAATIGKAIGDVIGTIGDVLTGKKDEPVVVAPQTPSSLIPGIPNVALALSILGIGVAIWAARR